LAASLLSVRRLQREETTGEAELRSRQRDEVWCEPVVYAHHLSLVTRHCSCGRGRWYWLVTCSRSAGSLATAFLTVVELPVLLPQRFVGSEYGSARLISVLSVGRRAALCASLRLPRLGP
jgi:hypothetical protein